MKEAEFEKLHFENQSGYNYQLAAFADRPTRLFVGVGRKGSGGDRWRYYQCDA